METKLELISVGIKANLKGFNYIIEMINIYKENRGTNMMKAYELVANKYSDSPSRVERAIRHAIETAYYDYESLKKIFKQKPTTKEFVFTYIELNGNFGGKTNETK